MGGPDRSPAEAIQALREAVAVIRLMWSGQGSVRYDGTHYQLAGVKPGLPPAHDVGIWLGVYGPRALQVLGETADGWIPSIPSIPSMPVAELAERHAIIDEAAEAAGRHPSEIRRLANVNGVITDGRSDGFLRGPEDQWAEQLADLAVNHGIDSFLLWPDGDLVEQTTRFTAVAEATRAVVAS